LDFRDKSILTQVAFKAAVDAKDDVLDENGAILFEARFNYFRTSLFEAVEVHEQAPAPRRSDAPQRSERAVVDRLRDEFDGEFVDNEDDDSYVPDTGGYSLKVVGKQQGPLPDWLIDQAEAKGVTAVYDNRPAEGNKPWFKEAVDTRGMSDAEAKDAKYDAQPFWPPQARGNGRGRR
jgi:hypothetical protein